MKKEREKEKRKGKKSGVIYFILEKYHTEFQFRKFDSKTCCFRKFDSKTTHFLPQMG